MKKFLLLVIGFIVCSTVIVPTVVAHVSETDGAVTGDLHTDEIIAGKQTTLDFIIKPKDGSFRITSCACTVTIIQKGKLPYTLQLTTATYDPFVTNVVHMRYMFPQKGNYEIIFTGRPNVANAFQPFTLRWNITVEKQAIPTPSVHNQNNKFNNILIGVIVSIIIGIILGGVFLTRSFWKKRFIK